MNQGSGAGTGSSHLYEPSRDQQRAIDQRYFLGRDDKLHVAPAVVPKAEISSYEQPQQLLLTSPYVFSQHQDCNISPTMSSDMQQAQQSLVDFNAPNCSNQMRQPNMEAPANIPIPSEYDVKINSSLKIPTTETSPFWLLIHYWEFNNRYGDIFKAAKECNYRRDSQPEGASESKIREVFVDGYCKPSSPNRFCLGTLNMSRSQVVDKVLQSIGKGARIYSESEGCDIYLECISEAPVFVQCPIHASVNSDDLATVYRLHKGEKQDSTICVFYKRHFEELLSNANDYKSAFDLQIMCQTRVSFAKGWGCEYRRATVTATPCWIDIQFAEPLSILDKLLLTFDEPIDEEICHEDN